MGSPARWAEEGWPLLSPLPFPAEGTSAVTWALVLLQSRPPILKTPRGGGRGLESTKAQHPTSNWSSNPPLHSWASTSPRSPHAAVPHPLHHACHRPPCTPRRSHPPWPLPSTPSPALKDPGEDSTSPGWAPSQPSLPTATHAARRTPAVAPRTARPEQPSRVPRGKPTAPPSKTPSPTHGHACTGGERWGGLCLGLRWASGRNRFQAGSRRPAWLRVASGVPGRPTPNPFLVPTLPEEGAPRARRPDHHPASQPGAHTGTGWGQGTPGI